MGSSLRKLVRLALQAGLERSPLAGRAFWRLPACLPAVALTFDDGPDPEGTPAILDLLAAAGARATFFVVGEQAKRYPEVVRRMHAEGHTVGNHTYSHVKCGRLRAEALRQELEATDAVLEALGAGRGRRLFRPPYGAIRPMQAWRLLRDGGRLVLWNRDSRDYRQAAPERIAAFGETLQPRDILLLHDRFPATRMALPRLLEGLAQRGLRTVSLSEQELPLAVGVRSMPPGAGRGALDGQRRPAKPARV